MQTVVTFLPLAGLAAAFVAVFAIVTRRKPDNTAYKYAVGLALAAAFVIIWVNLAVGVIGEPDNPANLMYFGVLAVGGIGAALARFEPPGMARALSATAGAQALVGLATLIAGLGPRVGVIVLNGFFLALLAASALLFRRAAPEVRRGRGRGGSRR